MDPAHAFSQNLRALVTASFAGLLRGCEPCTPDNRAFHPQMDVTRADIGRLSSGTATMRFREAKRTTMRGVSMQKDGLALLTADSAERRESALQRPEPAAMPWYSRASASPASKAPAVSPRASCLGLHNTRF